MKKLSKKWKIFIISMAVLVGALYGIYKINNRNAFEEMYNSYYNILPLRTIDNMPQIKPISFNDKELDFVKLYYKEKTDNSNIEFSLVNTKEGKKIILFSSTLISEEVNLDISYTYDMNTHDLKNKVSFSGEKAPFISDVKKQTRELLEKYNISKEYLKEKSDKLLDTVLTDWKNYSGSSYSKDNMGRLTIEKDEFLS
jgi:hypothetical protein